MWCGQIQSRLQLSSPKANIRATNAEPPQAGITKAVQKLHALQGKLLFAACRPLGCLCEGLQRAHFGTIKSTGKAKICFFCLHHSDANKKVQQECQHWPQGNEHKPMTGLHKKIVPCAHPRQTTPLAGQREPSLPVKMRQTCLILGQQDPSAFVQVTSNDQDGQLPMQIGKSCSKMPDLQESMPQKWPKWCHWLDSALSQLE